MAELVGSYEQTTGHEITCSAGFADECTCTPPDPTETAPTDPVSNASYPREEQK